MRYLSIFIGLLALASFSFATTIHVPAESDPDDIYWSPLGSGMDSTVRAMTVYDGKVIAGGAFKMAGGVAANYIASWDGNSWSPLGSGMNSYVRALTVYGGKLIAGGDFTAAGGVGAKYIASWNGSSWSPLGSGMNKYVEALTEYDGKLIAGGIFTTAGGVTANYIASWDGSSWSPLGSGMNKYVEALTECTGKLVAGGFFTTAGGVAANYIASWDGASWSSLGSGMGGDYVSIEALTEYDEKLIAGGIFTTAGGVATSRIASWNGSSWAPLGSGMNGGVFALAGFDGKLIAGGNFTTASGETANRIASWNGSGWSPLGSGIGGATPNVYALTIYDGRLVVGGIFTTAGTTSTNGVASWYRNGNALPMVVIVRVNGDSLNNHVIDHVLQFSWHYFDPTGSSPQTQFEIAVGTDNDWTHAEMWNPEAFVGPDTFVTYAGLSLVDGVTYYLRLRVHNGLAWSEWYNTSFRMNSIPTVPVNKHPDVLEAANTTTPTLWVINSSDAESDALFYDFEVLDFSENVVASASGIAGQADTTGWTVDVPLVENGFYYWQARAFDGYEYSAWSFGTLFLINETEEPPGAFLVYFPPDTDNGQVYDKPVTFWWGTSTDPDPIDTVRYNLLISIDPEFTFVATYNGLYATQYPVGNLNYSTHYWWKVQAVDMKGHTTTSTNTADFWTWILGDVNHDRTVNVGDAVFIINFIFKDGAAVWPLKTGDVNGDCTVNVGDAVALINYIFKGGDPPGVGCAEGR